jgi:ABC-type lipoprotein release transport system permease subunit
MVIKNLLRRKGRTTLTIIGISVGVASIIALGTLAQGLDAGYTSMLTGSKADLIVSQPDTIDIAYSSVDDGVAQDLLSMPEVEATSGMLQAFVPAEKSPYFFVFGFPSDSFVLSRFNIIQGTNFQDATGVRGKPVLIGATAADLMDKQVGDSLRLTESTFRIVGIYETGDAFEDSGAVLPLDQAQIVLGKPRQVSLVYIQLKDPALQQRLIDRVTRQWPDLAISTSHEFADKQMMGDMMNGFVWAIAGLAILIGGIGMANAQLMAVFERTREIGVLRAVGWSRSRVLLLILSESLVVALAGGLIGILLGWALLMASSSVVSIFGANPTQIAPETLVQALTTVMILGVVGGLYPAWRASRLAPLEALGYEGGTGAGGVRRLPLGGMAVQSLWQRAGRTLLTLSAIGLTVGAVMSLDGILGGTSDAMTGMATRTGSEIMIRQADVADTSLSAIDERLGSKIEAISGIRSVSGLALTALTGQEEGSFLIVLGYAPNEFGMRRFNVVEGRAVAARHEVMLGRVLADATHYDVGETMDIGGSRFRVVGIHEVGSGWEEAAAVVSLRDAQILAGRPRKVTMYGVKLEDPSQASEIVRELNQRFPEIHAALSGEFAEQMPDMQAADAMLFGISFLAILVGGVGVLNTMLMAVLERTREIGVLRTLGWSRIRVVTMIMRESLLLGALGAIVGVIVAFGITALLQLVPMLSGFILARWDGVVFARAALVALALGLIGGFYPALRASGLQPVEALRYE